MFLKKDPFKKRIFVGFNRAGAAGIYAFTRVLRRRGYQIDFYGINKTNFNMPVDFLLQFSRNRYLNFFQRVKFFVKILPKYDIWHFNYMDVFFFYPLNLLILKALGKKIVCTFRGAEVRSKVDVLSYNLFLKSKKPWPKYFDNLYVKESFFKKIKRTLRMKVFCALSDKVALTGPFLASSVDRFDVIVPYARDVRKLSHSVKVLRDKQKIEHKKPNLTVIHAPTGFEVKGSFYVERAFRHLTKKYPKVNFKIVSGLNHQDLLKEMSDADIVVDQLLVGWYGGLASEAMAMGKAVLAFLDPIYFQFVDFSKDLPIYNTNIWQLENDLETLINSPAERSSRAAKGVKFARKYHDASKIADEYLELYRGTDE